MDRYQYHSIHAAPTTCFSWSDLYKYSLFACFCGFLLYLPALEDYTNLLNEVKKCEEARNDRDQLVCSFCLSYEILKKILNQFILYMRFLYCVAREAFLAAKMQFYYFLVAVDGEAICEKICDREKLSKAADIGKEEVDKVIEDEITHKLSDDLLQSLERKFQVDLQKSVDMVLLKIKLLLKNGTTHIQDRLSELQQMLSIIKLNGEKELDTCLAEKQNETSALAEKALHQMVVCGYALIGHDPSQAVHSVMALKNMIRQGIKPIHEKKTEVHALLKVCGHDHDTLKKVIKCVISKSPTIKSAMMDITSKLIDGVVSLTKLMAHGAMHEACLIEVIRAIEDEAFKLVDEIKKCAYNNASFASEVNNYMKQNNATILDIKKERAGLDGEKKDDNRDMKNLIKKMLTDNKVQDMNTAFQNKLQKLTNDIVTADPNTV